MKRIGLTQRVDIITNYGEKRDALDQRWCSLLLGLDMMPIPLPNLPVSFVPEMLKSLHLDGIILTGGNSLFHLDEIMINQAPERDAFELALLSLAEKASIPTLGICRGMQIINHYFGGHLVKIEGHIAQKHELFSKTKSIPLPKIVNSYHSWTIPGDGLADKLESIGVDLIGNVEAFIHRSKCFSGIAWHPEREIKPDLLDLNFIKRNFHG